MPKVSRLIPKQNIILDTDLQQETVLFGAGYTLLPHLRQAYFTFSLIINFSKISLGIKYFLKMPTWFKKWQTKEVESFIKNSLRAFSNGNISS